MAWTFHKISGLPWWIVHIFGQHVTAFLQTCNSGRFSGSSGTHQVSFSWQRLFSKCDFANICTHRWCLKVPCTLPSRWDWLCQDFLKWGHFSGWIVAILIWFLSPLTRLNPFSRNHCHLSISSLNATSHFFPTFLLPCLSAHCFERALYNILDTGPLPVNVCCKYLLRWCYFNDTFQSLLIIFQNFSCKNCHSTNNSHMPFT